MTCEVETWRWFKTYFLPLNSCRLSFKINPSVINAVNSETDKCWRGLTLTCFRSQGKGAIPYKELIYEWRTHVKVKVRNVMFSSTQNCGRFTKCRNPVIISVIPKGIWSETDNGRSLTKMLNSTLWHRTATVCWEDSHACSELLRKEVPSHPPCRPLGPQATNICSVCWRNILGAIDCNLVLRS
jgi:hypothetical protein